MLLGFKAMTNDTCRHEMDGDPRDCARSLSAQTAGPPSPMMRNTLARPIPSCLAISVGFTPSHWLGAPTLLSVGAQGLTAGVLLLDHDPH